MLSTLLASGSPRACGNSRRRRTGASTLVAFSALLAGVVQLATAQSLVLERRIELPSVGGRLDHMAVDLEGQRLFVAALAADSLEVIDLREGKRASSIGALHEPQGVLYLGSLKRLLVANGAGGGVQAFNDAKAPVTASQASLDDADNLRQDPSNGDVYVGAGKALVRLDPDTLRILQRITLAGHPESFQIERGKSRIYVNVPTAGHIAVVDRESGKVAATWPLKGAARNFPMALDEQGHRLFVVTRSPALLVVHDTGSGSEIDRVPVCGDADDLFFDSARHQIYVVCGEGQVAIVRPKGPHLAVSERVPTAQGARTGLFVPSLSRLFVAVPARTSHAEIRAYLIR
ncbi:hypothetical protein WKW77_19825 [Variovorax ureilyticus]|uniref:DNA-binding beta-propeller fold protein YncE n=1 Tax=Variovorax ureilyticus TaxID=1836198 RepID=A0ABU8VJJ4_9BURK